MATTSVTVACVGSSSTAGKGQAFNWIVELAHRPQNRCFTFRNFGIGGDLSFNVLARLPQVLDCRPKIVVVAIGNNDVLALASPKARRFFRIVKRLPHAPLAAWFRENLAAIARGLKDSGRATVALCSLPPVGEDPDSAQPFQHELNRRSGQLNAMIKDIAQEESVDYIALNEAMSALAQRRHTPEQSRRDDLGRPGTGPHRRGHGRNRRTYADRAYAHVM
jgi:lysophospholipase L1-like esterase